MATSIKNISSHTMIMFALGLGALAGIIVNISVSGNVGAQAVLNTLIDTIAHPVGQIFLRLLFIVVVPLVFASLASGVAGLGDISKLGKIGGRTLLFFLITSAFAATVGITLLEVVRPGDGFDPAAREILMKSYATQASEIQSKTGTAVATGVLGIVNQILDMFIPRNITKAIVNMEMIPLIVFSLLLGAALTKIADEKREAMIKWLDSLSEAMITIVGFAMKLAPIAVFCLIFSVTARFGLDLLQKLGIYVFLILLGYAIVLFLFYPILLKILTKRNPIEFLTKASPIMVTAFSLSSSNGTLPTSIRISETVLGIRPKVASFVLPLGATMNMNGTALFEGAVVLFIAQVFGVDLSISQQILVVMLCVISSIGVAGVPGGSLPLLMIVMAQVGVPPDGIAIILGVDRLLDMGRTVINVMGDVVCSAYINDSVMES
ncbi:MAG: dicarboxylate/amino acid:cation symporter [Ignavibacteriales bacterium]|nr:dicarboxylate/amino acid:cation symporter [Ignavibacteriales bacterium]